MVVVAILDLFERRSIRRHRKPYPRTKHEVDRISRCRDMAIRVCWGAYGTPIFGRRGGRRGSAMAPLERAMVVSYRLSIVTVVSPTLKSTGAVTLGPNLGVFP